MKTVLIIGADFTPSSLPPATRIRFFSTHLSEFGWEPIVLTTRPEYYECDVDPENEQLVPGSVQVIRTNAFSSRWTRRIGIGDIGIRTVWHHWETIKRLCGEQKIDLILIPVPPYVPMVLGRLAHQKFGIPYVIDYIDPWITDSYNKLPRDQRPPKWFFADLLSRILEPFSVKHVAHLTGVSKGTTEAVIQRYQRLSEADTTEIPYGAESDDFEHLRQRPRQNPIFDPADGYVHLSCVGACIPGMYAAVRALFEAVRLGLERAPDTFRKARLHFVGTNYGAHQNELQRVAALAFEAGIELHVTEHEPRIPYLESLQVMLDSHALFMVGSDEPHYTASKVFPYLLARRPLLAIFHEDSSVVRILRETNSHPAVTFSNDCPPDKQVAKISIRLEQLLSGPQQSALDATLIAPYTTRAMTARLAHALDHALLVSRRRVQSVGSAKPDVRNRRLDY